jgi:hypothetical protein
MANCWSSPSCLWAWIPKLLTIVSLLLPSVGFGSTERTWITASNMSGCLVTTNDGYNQALTSLAQRLFKRYDASVGCITSQWLAPGYDVQNPTLFLKNHAGLDFRVRPGGRDVAVTSLPIVYAAFGGTVVTQTLDSMHSTLVIESVIGETRYRSFYLHCSDHLGNQLHSTIARGDPVCRAGGVGAFAQHLHLEVKMEGTSDYNFAQPNLGYRAMFGSHCTSGVCSEAEIEQKTIDPVALIELEQGGAASWSTGPYGNNTDIQRNLSIPGASSIEVSIIGSTEYDFDYVYVYDTLGNQVRRLTGNINETFTVGGSSIMARLVSDSSITSSGVTITVRSTSSGITLSEAEKADRILDCIEQYFPQFFSPHQQTERWQQTVGIAFGRSYGPSTMQAVWNDDFWYYLGSWTRLDTIENLKQFCPRPW